MTGPTIRICDDLPPDHRILFNEKTGWIASALGAKYIDQILESGWAGVSGFIEFLEGSVSGLKCSPIEAVARMAERKMYDDLWWQKQIESGMIVETRPLWRRPILLKRTKSGSIVETRR